MAMKVETFEQSEVVQPTIEQDDAERMKTIELAKELGLDGQVALQTPQVEPATIVSAFKWRTMGSGSV